jgi:hypothetical protein
MLFGKQKRKLKNCKEDQFENFKMTLNKMRKIKTVDVATCNNPTDTLHTLAGNYTAMQHNTTWRQDSQFKTNSILNRPSPFKLNHSICMKSKYFTHFCYQELHTDKKAQFLNPKR